MASTRSIVATLVILVGVVQLAAATSVCEVCEDIPASCLGNACSAISPGKLAASTSSNVPRKVCVTYGDIPNPFTMACSQGGTQLNVAAVTCSSKIYVYTVDEGGNRVVFRAGPSNLGLCTAQRGFCAPAIAAALPAPTIDTTSVPWQITAGTWTCKLGTEFASNNRQLYCA